MPGSVTVIVRWKLRPAVKSASAASVPVTVCGPRTLVSTADHVTATGATVPFESTFTVAGRFAVVPRRTVSGTAFGVSDQVPWPKPLSSQYEASQPSP